jgi:phosphoglycerate dehydrogenase-like enzyme
VSSPAVFVGPKASSFAAAAVRAGGGELVASPAAADAIVWLDHRDTTGLAEAIAQAPALRWVQLPFAGVDNFVESGVVDGSIAWTSAKGAYAKPVAEHALALALAGLRALRRRVEARSWGEPYAETLFGAKVAVLGAGGIASVLLSLLAPFGVSATVVRRRTGPVDGAAEVVGLDALHSALRGSLVVFLALSLTPETRGVIGRSELEAMEENAWLVNVARGPHVDTGALVEALRQGAIGGAALDVTDPEPLPDGHPLWELPNCIVTPHTADTPEMVRTLLAERICENVRRFATGEELVGLVDPDAGY